MLLHRRKQYHVFRLEHTQPFFVEKEELERKGFTPTGNLYLCFKLIEEIDIKNDNMLIQSFRKGRVNAIPYLFSFEM